MNTLRLPLLTVFAASLLITSGCDSDSEEITATASESGETSSTGETDETSPTSSTAATGESGSETATSTSGLDSEGDTEETTDAMETEGSDTDAAVNCADAQSAETCQDTELSACQWFPTTTVAFDNEMMCGDLGFEDEGRCIAVSSEINQCPGSSVNNCDDGSGLFYRVLGLEVGAVELLKMDPAAACDAPADMLPCQLNSDPIPGSVPSYFPSECDCLCAVPT